MCACGFPQSHPIRHEHDRDDQKEERMIDDRMARRLTEFKKICKTGTSTEFDRGFKAGQQKQDEYCEAVRPLRKTMCQKKKGHKGSCRAVIFWEKLK